MRTSEFISNHKKACYFSAGTAILGFWAWKGIRYVIKKRDVEDTTNELAQIHLFDTETVNKTASYSTSDLPKTRWHIKPTNQKKTSIFLTHKLILSESESSENVSIDEEEHLKIVRQFAEDAIGEYVDALDVNRFPGVAFTSNSSPLQQRFNTFHKEGECPFTFYETQTGNQCARHAINNAFGEAVYDDYQAFKDKVIQIMKELIPEFEANNFSDQDFAVDPHVIQEILEQGPKKCKTKVSQIVEFPGYEESKSKAISDYIGEANWILIYHNNFKSHPMPIPKGASLPYVFASGHIIAVRKDADGNWWTIDSNNLQGLYSQSSYYPQSSSMSQNTYSHQHNYMPSNPYAPKASYKPPYKLNIPLTMFHKTCQIIVPI